MRIDDGARLKNGNSFGWTVRRPPGSRCQLTVRKKEFLNDKSFELEIHDDHLYREP
jgi:hypothetical protein